MNLNDLIEFFGLSQKKGYDLFGSPKKAVTFAAAKRLRFIWVMGRRFLGLGIDWGTGFYAKQLKQLFSNKNN